MSGPPLKFGKFPKSYYQQTTKDVVLQSNKEEAAAAAAAAANAAAVPAKGKYIAGMEPPLAREARLRHKRILKYGYDPLVNDEMNDNNHNNKKYPQRNQDGGPIAAYMRRCENELQANRRKALKKGTAATAAGAKARSIGVARSTVVLPTTNARNWFDEQARDRSQLSTDCTPETDPYEDTFWDLTAWQRNQWQWPCAQVFKQQNKK